METGRLRVVLAMETSLLTSAIQQGLAGNPRLDVEVRPPSGHATGPIDIGPIDTGRIDTAPIDTAPIDTAPTDTARTDVPRTVRIELLEDPVRFALQADGREWILEYQGVHVLAEVLADLENVGTAEID